MLFSRALWCGLGAALMLLCVSAGAKAACSIPRPIDQPRTGAPNLGIYTNDYTVITGGCIDGTAIGQNTPAAGSFSTLTVGGALAANTKFSATYSFTGMAAEQFGTHTTTTVTMTADSANDILGLDSELGINQAGFHLTAQHPVGLYGNGYANGSSGTVDNVSGVLGVSGNQGAGTVTTAADFRGHTPLNNGGGTLTNHVTFYDPGGCGGIATNCLGAAIGNPVIVGDTDSGLIASLPAGYAFEVFHGPAYFFRSGGGAQPATSGASQSTGLKFRVDDNSGAVCDWGMNGASGGWVQCSSPANLAAHFPFQIQPNGGNIILGGPLTNTGSSLAGDSATDQLGVQPTLSIVANAHHLTSLYNTGLYAYGALATAGTVDNLSGVIGFEQNTSTGTVTNGASFRSRVPINNGGGTLTNHFAFLDTAGCSGIATNCYGGVFGNPSAMSDTDSFPTPVAGYALTVFHGPEIIRRSGGGAAPASSGSAQSTGQKLRLDDNSGAICDFGINGTTGGWMQCANSGNLATNYPMLIQPNGGNTSIGGPILNTGITTDATHTDATVCEDTTTHQFYFGSGASGICLGTSSLRFKKDVGSLGAGLDAVLQLEPIHYRYKPGYGTTDRDLYGFAAEQVEGVLPELVGLDAEGKPNSVDWAGIVPVLVNAIKQQQQEIAELRRDIRR